MRIKLLLFTLLILSSCTSREPASKLEWAIVKNPQITDTENLSNLDLSLESSLNYLHTRQPQSFEFNNRKISNSDLYQMHSEIAKNLATLNNKDFLTWLRRTHCFLQPKTSPLFTGYYRAQLKGRKNKTATFKYPIYAEPKDLLTLNKKDFPLLAQNPNVPNQIRAKVSGKRLIPFDDRKSIDRSFSLANRAKIIAWTDDPIELFFLHIQGSGVIALEDGQKIELGYANSNGWPYRAIGNELLRKGYLKKEEISKQSIVNFLVNNKHLAEDILDSNPSYVFFQVRPGGVFGNLQQNLIPKRSIASDHSIYPPATLLWLQIEQDQYFKEFSALVTNLDIGGAIKGQHRFDLYFGEGSEAELLAGSLKNTGKIYLILPKTANGACSE